MLYLPRVIRRPLGKVRRAVTAAGRPVAFHSARTSLLACSALLPAEKEILRKISLRVSKADDMYVPGEAQQYLAAGLSALRCITLVLDHLRAGRTSIRSALDLPSGGGRVLRFLRVAFPDAALVACDTNEALLEFCGTTFDASVLRSVPDINQLHLSGNFDLIWCGSLLTHFDERRCADLLRFFYNHLSRDGVCIFSAHGATAVGWLRNREFTFELSDLAQQALLSQVKSGFGYVNYDGLSDYGISLIDYERMIALATRVGQWSLAAFLESGWDNFHDIYAFTKYNVTPLINAPQRFLRPTNWLETRI
jgi:SAM-dependent methyltransferase